MSDGRPIRLLIADTQEVFLEGLKSVIESQSDLVPVGLAHNGPAALQLAMKEKPDVAVLDVSLALLGGIEVTKQICARLPATRVLCLAADREENLIYAMLAAGAAGFLLKECTVEEFILAVRSVHAAGNYLPPAASSTVIQGFLSGGAGGDAADLARLTAREKQTLRLIAEGKRTKIIAALLNVSVKTVGTYREHLMRKLEIDSVAGLTKYAVRTGVTTLDRD